MDERWRELLPRLREGDADAWAVIVEDHFGVVYAGMLEQTRQRNSHYRGPLSEPAVQQLAKLLTEDAFAITKHRIGEFDPLRSALPTWVRWQGMRISKGLIDGLLRQERDRKAQDDLDGPRPPRVAPHPGPEAVTLAGEERAELRARIDAILRNMRAEWAAALVQLQQAQSEGHPHPIEATAERSGRSREAMSSLLRRASKDFQTRWREAYGDYPTKPAD